MGAMDILGQYAVLVRAPSSKLFRQKVHSYRTKQNKQEKQKKPLPSCKYLKPTDVEARSSLPIQCSVLLPAALKFYLGPQLPLLSGQTGCYYDSEEAMWGETSFGWRQASQLHKQNPSIVIQTSREQNLKQMEDGAMVFIWKQLAVSLI